MDTPYAHGTGPHYGSDVYASYQDNSRPVAYLGEGKDVQPPVNKYFYVNSWWSSDKVQSFTVRPEAQVTFVNSEIVSDSVSLQAFNGQYSAKVDMSIANWNSGGTKSSSKALVYIFAVIVALALIVGIVGGVRKFGGDEDDEGVKETSMQKQGTTQLLGEEGDTNA